MLTDRHVPVTAAADLLGQRATIDTLAAAIGRLPAPACVAVYGPWGSGKTNILRNAWADAQDPDRGALHVPVWFDPWEYDQQPDLIGPLVRALLVRMRAEVARDPHRGRRFVEAAKGLGRMLLALGVRLAVRAGTNALLPLPFDDPSDAKTTATAGDTGKLDIESWLAGAGDPVDEVAQIKARFKALVDETLRLTGEGGVPGDERRVVFFLDDLDRCLPDRVVELIERIKLLLCGDTDCKAIFVFALDRRIVGEAIRNRFAGASQYTGENYLEKIFDLSLETPSLPTTDAGTLAFLSHCARELSPGGIEAICRPLGGTAALVRALRLPPLANPRVMKRTLNRLSLLLVGPRVAAVEAITDDDQRARGLAWLAGAERFRVLRHLVRSGDAQAVSRLIEHMRGAHTPTLLGDTARLVGLPGLMPYLEALGLVDGSDRRKALAQFGDAPVTPGSLRWWDDLMRSAGL